MLFLYLLYSYEIDLRATSSVMTSSRIFICGLPLPIVCRTLDEFHVVWALCITVSRTITSTSTIFPFIGVSPFVHFDKIKGTINTARKIARVHIKCELAVLQIEHVVRIGWVHEVGARTHVGHPSRRFSNEIKGEGITLSVDAIGVHVPKAKNKE